MADPAPRADSQLEARINTFELAFRMQTEASTVFDLTKETKETRERYGDTVHGRQLLLTRRLLELQLDVTACDACTRRTAISRMRARVHFFHQPMNLLYG